MIFRLAFYLAGGAVALTVVGATVYRVALRPALNEWRARRQARLNAEHTCGLCFEAVDSSSPDAVYDHGWKHRACLRRLLA